MDVLEEDHTGECARKIDTGYGGYRCIKELISQSGICELRARNVRSVRRSPVKLSTTDC